MWENVDDDESENGEESSQADSKSKSSNDSIDELLDNVDGDEFIDSSKQDSEQHNRQTVDHDKNHTPAASSGENPNRVQWDNEPHEQEPNNRQNRVTEEQQTDNEKTSEIDPTDAVSYIDPPNDNQSFITNISWPGQDKFNTDEELIMADNPSIYSNLYNWIFGGIAVIGGGILIIHWLITGFSGPLRQTTSIFGFEFESVNLYVVQLCLLMVVGSIQIVYYYIKRKFVWYILTDQRVWVREGVFFQSQSNIEHEDITNTKEINPYPERIFGVGTIKIFTAGTNNVEMTLTSLNGPNEWVNIIRNQM